MQIIINHVYIIIKNRMENKYEYIEINNMIIIYMCRKKKNEYKNYKNIIEINIRRMR